jgi:hypothetical protein
MVPLMTIFHLALIDDEHLVTRIPGLEDGISGLEGSQT